MRAYGAREGQSADGREAERERRESGGRGADRAADYREKMLRRGMDTDAFRFIEETFRNGMPPHGGFAIGLERITACFLGIANVKECSMFPRDINRVAP
jgi:nondiscriminating aspartyl-tRNA synthetase